MSHMENIIRINVDLITFEIGHEFFTTQRTEWMTNWECHFEVNIKTLWNHWFQLFKENCSPKWCNLIFYEMLSLCPHNTLLNASIRHILSLLYVFISLDLHVSLSLDLWHSKPIQFHCRHLFYTLSLHEKALCLSALQVISLSVMCALKSHMLNGLTYRKSFLSLNRC